MSDTIKTEAGPAIQMAEFAEPQRQPLAQQVHVQMPMQVTPPSTPASWMDAAIRANADPERIKLLMDLWLRWKAEQRFEAFAAAVAAFHAENPVVTKDKRNDQFGSWYTTLGNLVQSVSPILGRHGLSVDWDIDNTAEPGFVTVNCTLQHGGGHKRTSSIRLPEDNSGKKNPLQEIKSAITYGRGITFEAVLGLASSDEANDDDDGNGAGRPREDANAKRDASRNAAAGVDKEALLDAGQAKALEGTASLTKWWSSLSGPQRSAITPEFAHMKKAARIVDDEKGR